MSIDRVIVKEIPGLGSDSSRAHPVSPLVQEPIEHAPGPEFVALAQLAQDGELIVCKAHVCLVGLHIRTRDGFEFGCWDGSEEGV